METDCVFTGRRIEIEAQAKVLVTASLPKAALAEELCSRRETWGEAGLRSIAAIDDAAAPGTIAATVFAGRR